MNSIEVGDLNLALASLLLVVVGALGIALRLGVGKSLLVAAVRTTLQLLLLGGVLNWVFEADALWIVLALVASMIVNASIAAVRRTERRFTGIWLSGLAAVTLSTVFTSSVVLSVVIPADPWHEPRVLIPLVGLILGNALTGLGLCLDTLMRELDSKRSEVECRLALGATAWEACQDIARNAIRTGMMPILNSMTVVGIVSIPGMMTGQILAGADPQEAVRYQIVVMFMVAAATSLSAIGISLLAFRQLVSSRHQLAAHRLTIRKK